MSILYKEMDKFNEIAVCKELEKEKKRPLPKIPMKSRRPSNHV